MQEAKAGYLRNQELDDELIGQVVEYMVSLDAGSRMASRDPRVRFDRNRAFYTIKRALNRLVKKNQIVPEQIPVTSPPSRPPADRRRPWRRSDPGSLLE